VCLKRKIVACVMQLLLQWRLISVLRVYCWATCHCQQCRNVECCTKNAFLANLSSCKRPIFFFTRVPKFGAYSWHTFIQLPSYGYLSIQNRAWCCGRTVMAKLIGTSPEWERAWTWVRSINMGLIIPVPECTSWATKQWATLLNI